MIVKDILYTGLRLAGVIQLSGRTASLTEYSDAFDTLNAMMDGFNAEQLLVYGIERKVCQLQGSVGTYTCGTGGAFNFPRPAKIEAANVLVGTPVFEQQIEICVATRWAQIINKGEISNFGPRFLFYETLLPVANVLIAPMPISGMTMTLYVWSQLAQFATQADTVSLPVAYRRLIEYNLAVELSLTPRFRRFAMDPGVAALAKQFRGEIAALNASLNFGAAPATEAK